MKKIYKMFGLALSVVVSPYAYAVPAVECVQVQSGDSSASLYNACGQQIEVVWCVDSSGNTGDGSAVCGQGGNFYQKHRTLRPGQSYANRYDVPSGGYFRWAACTGGYYTVQHNSDGSFYCKD